MSTTDTIAAIATPHAAGGISVIRISGSGAVALAQACFRSVSGKTLSAMPGYTCTYGSFLDTDGTPLDDGIATVFRAPHSYTGEDTVEFSCHGGIYVTRRILQAVLHAGASAAQPGEFTKRAFLSGKMTLTQAEAVMDVIGAAGNRELRFARAQQEGALYRRVRQITQKLVHCLGDLAAWADYPEDEIPAVTPEGLQQSLTAILQPLEQTLATYDYGRILRAGVSAVIVGKPNVGKSTFINKVAHRKTARAEDRPGVTRSKQWVPVDAALELLDTPGILWPKFDDPEVGKRLAFTGAVKDDVLDIEELACYLMDYLAAHYADTLTERYKIEVEPVDTGYELLEKAGRKRGFLMRGAQVDTERMARILLDEFRAGKLGRFTLETVEN